MGYFVNNENVVLCSFVCNDKILLFKIFSSNEKSPESHSLKCPEPQTQVLSKLSNSTRAKEHFVVAAAVSNSGNIISACDSSNFLHLWKYDRNSWNHLSERRLIRKCQKIIFTNSGNEVVVADRGGDVFVFSVLDYKEEGKFLLGHISLIIDISLSSDDNYLLTCDRDGKIRVSYYPNSYNIHSYCLGHQEFVSSVQSIQLSQECILTASGDGSLRLWDFNGHNINTLNIFGNELICKMSELHSIGEKSENSLSCLLDEKQTTFAVRNIRYSEKTKLCAISFYLIKGIAIYCLSCVEGNNFKFIEFIPVESIPFDLFFNISGDLIILQKSVSKPYSYFKYTSDKNVCFKEDDPDHISLFEEFRNLCGNIENLYEVQDNWETLFKKNFDDKDDVVIYQSNSKKNKVV